MSFFRVLLALLISGGIAYGLYRVVDGQGVERVVEAVRTEIQSSGDTDPVTPGEGEADAPARLAEPEDDAVAVSENAPDAEAEDTSPVPTAGTDDDTAENTSEEEEGASEAGDDAEALPMPEEADGESIDDSDAGDAPDPDEAPVEETSATGDSDEAASFAARIQETLIVPAQPTQPNAPAPDSPVTAEETDGGETPSLIAPVSGPTAADSARALDVVSGGMSYVEARATLIDAGWTPRIPAPRAEGANAAETVMIDAGYSELEGCKDSGRPLCRFEFVDGEKRIAAILTAGTGADPSVIDAFLMNIRAE